MSDALKPMTAEEFAESLASIPNAYKMDRDYYDRIALALKEREQLLALRQRISELAEALRERMEKCERCNWVGSAVCNLCRKASRLLEGRGT